MYLEKIVRNMVGFIPLPPPPPPPMGQSGLIKLQICAFDLFFFIDLECIGRQSF